jgi:hypothetical protein
LTKEKKIFIDGFHSSREKETLMLTSNVCDPESKGAAFWRQLTKGTWSVARRDDMEETVLGLVRVRRRDRQRLYLCLSAFHKTTKFGGFFDFFKSFSSNGGLMVTTEASHWRSVGTGCVTVGGCHSGDRGLLWNGLRLRFLQYAEDVVVMGPAPISSDPGV